jgi:hypothetical protein
MHEFMMKTALGCKEIGRNCRECESIAVFMYNQENQDSPDYVPLDNIVRWRSKFQTYCSAVMNS